LALIKEHEWKKNLETSDIYLGLISEGFFEQPRLLEQFLYAKSLKKPMVLLIQKGSEVNPPDIFDGADIRAILDYDEDENLSRERLLSELNKIRKELRK
jgi:hypothetical protein